MIIDAHSHLGYDCVFDWTTNENDLIESYDKNGIDGAVIQPLINRPYVDDTVESHNRIYKFCLNNPGRFWGMACINPHFRHEDYKKEAERCVKDLNFVGLKLNPQGHAVHPASKDGFFVFECARNLGVPVMVHTGIEGMSFSDPVSLISVIEKFQDVKIILAHAGSDSFFQQALYISKKFKNIYLEPSWLNILNLKAAIGEIGPERVMFSTDEPVANAAVELKKYREALKESKNLERVFSGTTIEVFDLKT